MAERRTTEITKRIKKRPKRSSVLSQMEALLSVDLYLTDFEKIAPRVQRLNQSGRRRLLSLCERAFSELGLRKDEPTRLAAVKGIVALVPDSTDAIRHWINTKSGKDIYEVHFSLFCFLDEVPDLPHAEKFATEIPSLIEQYLLNVETRSASAAWMAGDLLGNHWEMSEALPILLKVAKEARFVAGRAAAAYGLEYILHNLPKSNPRRKTVISLLREIAENDRSEYVKIAARESLSMAGNHSGPVKRINKVGCSETLP